MEVNYSYKLMVASYSKYRK